MKKILFLVLASFALHLLFASCNRCKKKDCKAAEPEAAFDRKAMLSNIGNNIIIPNYQWLQTEVNEMDAAVAAFTDNPSGASLNGLRSAFREAYVAWQHCSAFEFGPAEQNILRASVNTFPTDTAQINSNISSGSYDLNIAANMDAKGFPAIDFLIYGLGADSATISAYANANRNQYLKNVSAEIKAKTDAVTNQWLSAGGNYISTFVSAEGSDVGSSLGLLVNQLNYDYELIKNPKIGIPLGKKTLGTPMPGKVEAYYSGISSQLALENILAIENLYLGRSREGTDGAGIDEYLVFLQSQHNGGLLSDAIKAQLTAAVSTVRAVPDPLSQTVTASPAVVETAYTEIQKQVVLFKTDMPSALGVLITYQDNDGD